MKDKWYAILWLVLGVGIVASAAALVMRVEHYRVVRATLVAEQQHERQIELDELEHTRHLERLVHHQLFLERLEVNRANWRFEIGEAHLRIIQVIVEDAVTGLVNDEAPLQRLKRETR